MRPHQAGALDAGADRSRLIVLDGATFVERARATLPHAVPFDRRGRYFPDCGRTAGVTAVGRFKTVMSFHGDMDSSLRRNGQNARGSRGG